MVKKRIVYYLSGFDPRGVRHYHALYKEHSKKQTEINGIETTISSRKKIHNHLHQWEIDAIDGGLNVHTTYRFLSWDDIIRAQWSSGLLSSYKDLVYFTVAYLVNGLVLSFAKASPKQMLAGFYPFVYLLGALFIALYAGFSFHDWWSGWIALIPSIGITLSILVLFERLGNKIGVFWLLRIYVFSARWGKGKIPTIEDRMNQFAQEIVKALKEENGDEILLVSHSVGTILAVSILARALQKEADGWEKFGMITLGECIPLVSFQPNAKDYRNELSRISKHKELVWIDYTSPIDGACFPLHDFMQSSGVRSENSSIPRYLSTRFHKLYDKITYKKLRRDWYTIHFLYLTSAQKSGAYDYFAITAGSTSLRSRFFQSKEL